MSDNSDKQALKALLGRLIKANQIVDENKSGFDKLFEAVDVFGTAIKNRDDIADLCDLLDEQLPAAEAGNRKAKMAVRAYKDELKSKLLEIGINVGVSITVTGGGILLTMAGYSVLVECTAGAAACTGVLMCTMGGIAAVLGTIALGTAIFAGLKVIWKLLTK